MSRVQLALNVSDIEIDRRAQALLAELLGGQQKEDD